MYMPHITIYTDNLPANMAGCANGPVIRIRPKYKNDAGLHAHEMEHVRQWYVFVALGALVSALLRFAPSLATYAAWWQLPAILSISVHSLAYLLLPSYRLWAEVQAYVLQAGYYPDDRRALFAQYIASNYKLDVTVQQVMAIFKE